MRRCTFLYYTCQVCSLLVEAAPISTATGTSIAGGLFHTCVIVSDLSLRCFGGGSADEVPLLAPSGSVVNGFGNFGQLGTGNNETLGDEDGEMGGNLAAVDLGENTAQEVAAGQSHTCVLLTSGDVACFGFNLYGQLGLGDTSNRGLSAADMGEGLAFVDLGEGRTATHISCGQHNTCAVLDNGDLKCWGNNEFGMLGLGDTVQRGDKPGTMGDDLQALDLGKGQTAVAVDGGRYHTCAILGSGGVKCWGGHNGTDHNYGQLGQESTFDIGVGAGQMGDNLQEIDLGTGRTAVALACGWFHTCVILDNAKMHCFGRNFDGQLGLGDTADRGYQTGSMGDAMASVDLGAGRYPVALTAGRWHTCVLLDNDDVKCFGANTADDLGAGQLGLEDTANRGISLATMGDGLEAVELGIGRVAGWIFAAFDHNCVIFSDFTMKCWGLNKSGQLGIGDTDDRGANVNTMGDSLPVVQPGLRLACPPSPASFDADGGGGGDGGGLSTELTVAVYLIGAGGALFVVGAICLCCRRRMEKQGDADRKIMHAVEAFDSSREAGRGNFGGGAAVESGERVTLEMSTSKPRGDMITGVAPFQKVEPELPQQQLINYPLEHRQQERQPSLPEDDRYSHIMSGSHVGMAAAGTAGMAIAGGLAAGWNVIGVVAENLPWIGVAYHMLNEVADIVDTKNAMQGNMEKIKNWAISLQDVLLQMAKQMKTRPAVNARALEHMSTDVISALQTLVNTVGSYNAKGALAQYAASRSCQKAVDAADTALRGALVKLSVGQGAELMAMVGRLQDAGLVVDGKLDMIIEHLRKQDEHAARLELRLAEYSESMAEVLGQFARGNATIGGREGQQKLPPAGKTLRALGEEQLDKLQISKVDVSYPSNLPFASGTYSEVYQVIHEGVIKAAKKTNLARLGVGGKDVNRVFGRFVKELYILSQMHSDRVVSVYGAIASPTELTLVMEFVERGSIRTILDDDAQRKTMTSAVKHGLLVDTAEGMAYLYNNGVEHRDLKSANCLVTHDWRVKISDFGLSNTNDAISTGSGSTMSSNFRGGTMVYMAPELLPGGAGREVPTELSDVYSFGIVVWDVVCGEGETPWAGVSVNELPLTLKMGTRLDIPAQCGRFYRKLMVNCWRQDPHRRPNFDRVLYAVKKEAESSSCATPTLSPSTKSTCIQRGLSGSPAPVQRTKRSGSAPTISKQSNDTPGGSASTYVEPTTRPQLARHGSAPSHNDAPPRYSGYSGGLPRVSRRDCFPALAKNASHERRVVSGSDRKGRSPPRATATVNEAVPRLKCAPSGAGEGQKRSRFTSRAIPGQVADSPGDASTRLQSARSAGSSTSSFAAQSTSRQKSTQSVDSLTPQATPLASAKSDDMPSPAAWQRVATKSPTPPTGNHPVLLPVAAAEVSGRSSKRKSDGGHGAPRPDDAPRDAPLGVARTASLASRTSSSRSDDDLATSGRSASLNAKVPGRTQPRQHGLRTKDSARQKAKVVSHRGSKGADPVHGAGSGMSSTPGCQVARPVADGRESRQPEAKSRNEAQRARNRDKRGGDGQVWAGGFEALAGEGGESREEEEAEAGREGSGPGRGRSKKSQKVQVLHGFRLVTTASAGGGATGNSSGVRGEEHHRAP